MGNAWRGISKDALNQYEAENLQFTGMQAEDFEIHNVIIDDEKNHIKTIQIGDIQKVRLVLVHGYGASGIIFYKIMKKLSEIFHVIMIDIIGMVQVAGQNSKLKLQMKLMNGFSKIQKNGDQLWETLRIFILLVIHLVAIKKKNKAWKWPSKYVKSLAKSVWKHQWSPFGIMRKSGKLIGKKLIRSYMKKRMSMLPEDEFETLLNYMHLIFMRSRSSEYAIFIQFHLGMFAINPLECETRLGSKYLNLPNSFFYGDIDWMDKRAGRRVVVNNIYDGKLSHVYIVNKSDHHMYFDNPEEFVDLIIKDVQDTEEKSHLIKKDIPLKENNHIDNFRMASNYFDEMNLKNI
eukprot:403348908